MENNKTVVVGAQIPREVFDKLDALAKSQDRTYSYLIRKILTEALMPRGAATTGDQHVSVEQTGVKDAAA